LSAGLVGGIFTVNLMEIWLRKFAFWKALLFITIVYTIAAVLISMSGAIYINSENLDLPLFHPKVIDATYLFFGTWLFIKNFILWLGIVIVTLIILMVNDKYGPGVFPDYLMGRYFRPKKEQRIFMFADLKNATGIAENLGEEQYFNFLKDFFSDIAPAIIETRGEVYQYVGDEIVVSWKMKSGLKNANAIQCFYSMLDIVNSKSDRYLKRYGVIPKFRTGYHCGSVMVGEIGQIKRDIAFSGDVLNTTSRIQGLCGEFGLDILASMEFATLNESLPKNIKVITLGKEKLRGKIVEIELVTFKRVELINELMSK
jgi:adenylate cyclase